MNIGVIGVGQIGKNHLTNYQKIESANVVAIADINAEESGRVSQQFSVPDVYSDFRELLARDDIEAVDVCLHNNFHRPMTVAALEAGKHVYCEKPMAGSYRDAEAMWDAAQKCGRKLSIQLSTLFTDETRAAKSLVDAGKLGELYHARSSGYRRRGRPFVDGYGAPPFVQKRNSGGGALYDMGVYHIANVLYLLGNPDVQRVVGKTYQKTAMDEAKRQESGYDVEELGLGLVHLGGEATLDIIEAWAIHLGGLEGSSVVGGEGGVRLDPFGFYSGDGKNDIEVKDAKDKDQWTEAHARIGTPDDESGVYGSAQAHWIAALEGRVELLPTAQIALNTMLISEGIYLSNELGREVTADEVREMSKSTAVF